HIESWIVFPIHGLFFQKSVQQGKGRLDVRKTKSPWAIGDCPGRGFAPSRDRGSPPTQIDPTGIPAELYLENRFNIVLVYHVEIIGIIGHQIIDAQVDDLLEE